MITRVWHGYTLPQSADAYEQLLKTTILPGIHRIAGYRGAYLLRRDAGAEVEFITVTLWESMEAIRAFAGTEHDTAVIPEPAAKLLARYDARSVQYAATWCP